MCGWVMKKCLLVWGYKMNFLYSKFLLICEKYSNEKLDMLMYSGLNVNYILIVIFKQVSYNRFLGDII